jgi:DNA repair protein RadA/Sms
VEEAPEAEPPQARKIRRKPGAGAEVLPIGEIPDEGVLRLSTGIGELDRVLGGGTVEGSMTLIGGEPGIGKSTLLTQASAKMAESGRRVLYVSGEESARQIKLRAKPAWARWRQLFRAAENDMEKIEQKLEAPRRT